jgi:hypothetical protein
MNLRLSFAGAGAMMLAFVGGCGKPSQMPVAEHWDRYIEPFGSDGRGLRWRPAVCEGFDLRPDFATLDEASLIRFLQQQSYTVQVERQQVDPKQPALTFLFVAVPGAKTIPLRVAILPTPDAAGASLYDALIARGRGFWGFRRGTLAVLGPVGSREEDLEFAAKSKLACWGSLTVADGDDVVVVAGGYADP